MRREKEESRCVCCHPEEEEEEEESRLETQSRVESPTRDSRHRGKPLPDLLFEAKKIVEGSLLVTFTC